MNFRVPVILKILVAVIGGVLAAHYSQVNFDLWFLGLPVLITLFGLLVNHRDVLIVNALKHAGFIGFFFLTAFYLKNQNDSRSSEYYFGHYTEGTKKELIQFKVISMPVGAGKWSKFEAEISTINNKQVFGKSIIYAECDSITEPIQYGDLIYASAFINEIPAPKNPYEFDYKNYLALQDIHHQTFLRKEDWKKHSNDADLFFETIYNVKSYCLKKINDSKLSQEHKAVANALILGDKTSISDDLMLSYAATGALHVLAVSGLHVGIIMLVLSFLLRPIKRIKYGKWLFFILALSGIWFYALLTGLSPSVLRAAVMFSFVLLGTEMQRDTSIYQSLAVSATLLILLDPNVLFHLGFLLSYLAVFGIVFFHPKIYSLFSFKWKLIDKIWQISSVSIAAQIATLPIGLYCFQQFPNYFLAANLIVIPVSFLALVVGIFALLLSFIPLLSEILFYILDFLILLLNEGVKFIENLPGAITTGLKISLLEVFILYALIGTTFFAFSKRSLKLIFASGGLIIALLISLNINRNDTINNDNVVFYQTKETPVIDIFSGNSFYSISGKELNRSEKNFSVVPCRKNECGKIEAQKEFEIAALPPIKFREHTLQFVNQTYHDSLVAENFLVTDVLYFYNINYVSKELLNILNSKNIFVILGSDIPNKTRSFIASQIPERNLHNLQDKGALVFNWSE